MTFSSGAFVRADVSDWGMSLTLRAPSSDWSQTQGLCGTYDGQTHNDLHTAGGAVLDNEDVAAFISEWKLVWCQVSNQSLAPNAMEFADLKKICGDCSNQPISDCTAAFIVIPNSIEFL